MKKLVLALPALFLLSTAIISQPSFAEPVRETSEKTFVKDVVQADKPVVVDFFATWCGPCRAMEPVLENLSHTYAGKATFLRVDVDKNPELSNQFDISGIPAIMIFQKGKVVDNSVGAVPQKELDKMVAAVVTGGAKSIAKTGGTH